LRQFPAGADQEPPPDEHLSTALQPSCFAAQEPAREPAATQGWGASRKIAIETAVLQSEDKKKTRLERRALEGGSG
jgi:hypothetical protein